MLANAVSRLPAFAADVAERALGRHPELPTDYGLSATEADALLTKIYVRGDRLMGRFLLVHAGISIGLAFMYETWFVSAVVSLSALGLFFVNAWLRPATFATRVAAGIALQTFVALHIYQMHGLAEMHFWFFTAFTMMIVYQDWLCMWPGTLLIIGQHILFAVLHNSGVPLYFFEVDYITILRLFFHFGIAVVQVGICGYWAVLKRRETFTDAGQRARLRLQSLELAEARDQALAATKAKSEFLATMSHEIRTPMNGVIGMTSLLRQSSLNDEQVECVDVIQQSGKSLLRIIDDILDFSKVEAGRVDIEVNDFNLRALVEGTTDLVRDAVEAKGLCLRCETDPDVPSMVAGDAGRIRQVLLNYLSNAVKYTNHGGIDVAVSAKPVTDRAVELRFEVRDTGIGLSPDDLSRLFQSFSRVQTAGTQGISGTGLGLAICQRLARLMNGQVGASGHEGRGSTFWFVVPLRYAHGHAGTDEHQFATAASIPTVGRPWQVLVVDDNTVNQLVSTRLLQKLQCRVDVAANGAEAVDAVGRRTYDLVLMDCQMPVMDGHQATQAIRAREEQTGRRVPIIALTAGAIEGEREHCLASGMDDYLAKPVTAMQLAAVISRWLCPDERTVQRRGAA